MVCGDGEEVIDDDDEEVDDDEEEVDDDEPEVRGVEEAMLVETRVDVDEMTLVAEAREVDEATLVDEDEVVRRVVEGMLTFDEVVLAVVVVEIDVLREEEVVVDLREEEVVDLREEEEVVDLREVVVVLRVEVVVDTALWTCFNPLRSFRSMGEWAASRWASRLLTTMASTRPIDVIIVMERTTMTTKSRNDRIM